MKKSDIAMIVLIASIGIAIAFFATRTFFSGAVSESVKVKTVDPMTSSVEKPDPTIFNANAINPTVEISVGGTASQ